MLAPYDFTDSVKKFLWAFIHDFVAPMTRGDVFKYTLKQTRRVQRILYNFPYEMVIWNFFRLLNSYAALVMFEVVQVGVKLIIIAAIFLVAGISALKVWRADIDLRALLNPSRAATQSATESIAWLPTREPNAVYQAGEVVASVEGAAIDEKAGVVTFTKVSNAMKLDVQQEFEFRKWRLQFEGAESNGTIGGLAMKSDRVFGNVRCKIIGPRKPL